MTPAEGLAQQRVAQPLEGHVPRGEQLDRVRMPCDDIGDSHIRGDRRACSQVFLHLGRITLARRAAILVADSHFVCSLLRSTRPVFALAQGTRFQDGGYLGAT